MHLSCHTLFKPHTFAVHCDKAQQQQPPLTWHFNADAAILSVLALNTPQQHIVIQQFVLACI